MLFGPAPALSGLQVIRGLLAPDKFVIVVEHDLSGEHGMRQLQLVPASAAAVDAKCHSTLPECRCLPPLDMASLPALLCCLQCWTTCTESRVPMVGGAAECWG